MDRNMFRRLAYIGVVLFAVGSFIVVRGSSGDRGADAPTRVDAVTSDSAAAKGYSITFDGAALPDVAVASAVTQQGSMARAQAAGTDAKTVSEYAVTQAVLSECLYQLGKSLGDPVTPDDVTKALEGTDAIVSTEFAGNPQDPAANPISPKDVMDDPVIRANAERGLYRSRGFASILGGLSAGDPQFQAKFSEWFRTALDAHGVDVETPYGPVSHEQMVSLMDGPQSK